MSQTSMSSPIMFLDSLVCAVPSFVSLPHFLSLPPLLLLLLPFELELELELELDPDPDEGFEPEELLLDAGALMVIVGRKTGIMGGFLGGCDIVIFLAGGYWWLGSLIRPISRVVLAEAPFRYLQDAGPSSYSKSL